MRIGWVASMKPVGVKSSSPDRWPSWKIQTSAPNEAPSDSTFITSALTGSTTEPKARNSSTNVVADHDQGHPRQQVEPRLASRSVSTARLPADQHRRAAGAGTSRISLTRSAPPRPTGSPS